MTISSPRCTSIEESLKASNRLHSSHLTRLEKFKQKVLGGQDYLQLLIEKVKLVTQETIAALWSDLTSQLKHQDRRILAIEGQLSNIEKMCECLISLVAYQSKLDPRDFEEEEKGTESISQD